MLTQIPDSHQAGWHHWLAVAGRVPSGGARRRLVVIQQLAATEAADAAVAPHGRRRWRLRSAVGPGLSGPSTYRRADDRCLDVLRSQREVRSGRLTPCRVRRLRAVRR